MSSGSVLQVVILRNGALVGTEMLVPGDYRIGRDPTCELHIDEPTLSRVHARLVFNGNRVGLQDLGSDNGVLINGDKIQAREVKSLDDVTLGKVTLKFKIIGRKEDAPQPEGKAALERTVPLASRPNSAQLRAALEPVPTPPPARSPGIGARPPSYGARMSAAQEDTDVTAPGQPPLAAVARAGLNATQPSARRAQVAPEIKPQNVPAPPRPVIGLVPPPSASPKAAPPPPPAEKPTVQALPRAKVEVKLDAAEKAIAEKEEKAGKAGKRPPTQGRQIPKGSLDATVAKGDLPEFLSSPASPESDSGTDAGAVLAPTTQPDVRARVMWGNQMVAVRTFAFGTEIVAAAREDASLPVYEFGFEKPTVLGRVHSNGWAIHVPRGAIVEVRGEKGWSAAHPSVDGAGNGLLPLPAGSAARIRQGKVAVEFSALAPQIKLPRERMKLELSLLVPLVAGLAAAVSLVVFLPKNLDVPDFVPQKLAGIRPALLAPPPKPKEPPKEKEKVAEKRNEKKEQPQKVTKAVPKPTPKQPAPVAVAALQKLTQSPAMKSLLTVSSKIGGGGRPNGMKMVGLKGIGPVALLGAGPGTGGGFGGGPITQGREALLGIGAIGVSHALKGAPGGVVAAAPAKVVTHGSISREEIAKVINQHMQAIRACYEKALLHDPGLTGKLVIEWNIDLSGAVSSFKTKQTTMKNPDVGECILDNLKTWRFPRPTGGSVVVSYPFVFNSVGF